MTIRFIDVSQHDRNRRGRALDWNAIRNAGYPDICAVRVTYGDPQVFNPSSPYAAEMLAGAKAAGYISRIGYHNLIHGDRASIARQVDYHRKALDSFAATSGMVDIEPYPELKNNGLWPRWDDVLRYQDRWYVLDQRPLLWYLSRWVWSGWLGSPNLKLLKGPLTNANYGRGYLNGVPGWSPYGGRTPDVLQYSSTMDVPGASYSTDANAFRGTTEEFIALVSPPQAAPPSQPADIITGGMIL